MDEVGRWTRSLTQPRLAIMKLIIFMVFILAFNYVIKIKDLVKEVDNYDPKSLRHASYKSLKDIAYIIARGGATNDKSNKSGVPNEFKNIFRKPVPFTLNSITYFPRGNDIKNEVTFTINEDESKSNAPAKYLYPVIGGGSTEIYATRFLQYLRKRNYINNNQYPYPNTKYSEMIKKQDGKVKPSVYRNTIWGLSSTKNKKLKRKSKGSKIHDARVFASKDPFGGKYRAGIYRVKSDEGKDGMIKPLFIYGQLPKITPKTTFNKLVIGVVDKQFEKILDKNIKRVGKSI